MNGEQDDVIIIKTGTACATAPFQAGLPPAPSYSVLWPVAMDTEGLEDSLSWTERWT